MGVCEEHCIWWEIQGWFSCLQLLMAADYLAADDKPGCITGITKYLQFTRVAVRSSNSTRQLCDQAPMCCLAQVQLQCAHVHGHETPLKSVWSKEGPEQTIQQACPQVSGSLLPRASARKAQSGLTADANSTLMYGQVILMLFCKIRLPSSNPMRY